MRSQGAAQEKRDAFTRLFGDVEAFIERNLSIAPGPTGGPTAREKALAMTALEDVSMRISRALREEQLALRGMAHVDPEAPKDE